MKAPRYHDESTRRRLVRIPALTLVAVFAVVWAPCFACEGSGRAGASPVLVTPAPSCHSAGDLAVPECTPEIRAAGVALRVPVPLAPAAVPLLAGVPEFSLFAAPAPRSELPAPSPTSRPPLYLLHGSLLA